MPHKQNTILAIIPGRSRLGIAVFRHCGDGDNEGYNDSTSLLYYGGKSLKRYRARNLLLKAVRIYLKEVFLGYRITHLATRKLLKSQKDSSLLVAVAREIRLSAKKNNVIFCEYDAASARRKFCGAGQNGRVTKETVIARLIERYPELTRLRQRNRIWEKRYYGYVFEAIAIAEVCSADVQKKP